METFEVNGIETKQAVNDADLLISKTGTTYAKLGPTYVIGEDTDILVLLCYHAHQIRWNLGSFSSKVIKKIIHAIAGCDTTSRLFGIGKSIPLKKMDNEHFRQQAAVFCETELSSNDAVTEAGEKAVVCLYGGKPCERLIDVRSRKFREKVLTSASAVEVKTLPSTPSAALYHSLRVFLQVCIRMDVGDNLEPTEWGWEQKNDNFVPKQTDDPVAPEYLLKVLRCFCTGNCETKKCSCKRYGLECTNACKHCNGLLCWNPQSPAYLKKMSLSYWKIYKTLN